MKTKSLFLLIVFVVLTWRIADTQQQPTKIPRIGYLIGAAFIPVRSEALTQGLRELGYVEGKTILVEWRSAEGKLDRLPALAAELCVLRWMSLSRLVQSQLVPPSKQPPRFPLS
jgi:putative ABC transport system substrate-binding protein